jgi:hypothetical protein
MNDCADADTAAQQNSITKGTGVPAFLLAMYFFPPQPPELAAIRLD